VFCFKQFKNSFLCVYQQTLLTIIIVLTGCDIPNKHPTEINLKLSTNKNDYENAKFEFNNQNSDFVFVSNSMNSYIFMQKPDNRDIRPNNLFFNQLPVINDTILLKSTLNNVITNMKNNGITIKKVDIQFNKVDDNFAYTAIVNGDFESKPIYNKTVITSNKNIALLFGATLYNNIEINIPIVDSLIKSVKFKEKTP